MQSDHRRPCQFRTVGAGVSGDGGVQSRVRVPYSDVRNIRVPGTDIVSL